MDYGKDVTTSDHIGDRIRVVNNYQSSTETSPNLRTPRVYTPPVMGTSARAAKRRIDVDSGTMHTDSTDIYNHQLQQHYHNVRSILNDQKSKQIGNIDQPRQSPGNRQDYLEQHFKTTYDSPPSDRRPAQKIITTITTTTKTIPTSVNDNSMQQKSDTDNVTYVNTTKTQDEKPLFLERKEEQYRVILDSTKNENQLTNEHEQTETNQMSDDHQAIQNLTRVLQEHNKTTETVCKRLSAQSNPILINKTTTTTTTTIPSNLMIVDPTNKPLTSEYNVIDALLDNPIGTTNDQKNNSLHTRVNDIISNLYNTPYINLQTMKKEININQSNNTFIKTEESSQYDNDKRLAESTIQSTIISSDTTLEKENNKRDQETKKKSKIKSKQLSTNTDYQVIDAVIGSPISLRLPNSYLMKYHVNPPLSSTFPIHYNDNNLSMSRKLDPKATNETVSNLVKIVNELMLHHGTATTTTTTTAATKAFRKSITDNYPIEYVDQQRPITSSVQHRIRPKSEPVKPRILYRYLDERGRVLKFSSIPPSELHPVIPTQSKEYSYENTRPTHFESRRIPIENIHYYQHQRPEQKHRTVFENYINEPSSPITHPITIPIHHDHSTKTQTQHSYNSPTQQNIKLTWMPLSSQYEQQSTAIGIPNYDTDSSVSERSTIYRPYSYTPIDMNPPHIKTNSYNPRSTTRPYYVSSNSQGTRTFSPEHGGNVIARNYIEIFREGETKPSQVFSLPLTKPISTNHRHSRYDQYQFDRYGNSSDPSYSQHDKTIRSTSSKEYQTENIPNDKVNSNQNNLYIDNDLKQSKSFDYRPLRTKLQREYKITPSLLVDDWDNSQQSSMSTGYNKQTSLSSPDQVFISDKRTHMI